MAKKPPNSANTLPGVPMPIQVQEDEDMSPWPWRWMARAWQWNRQTIVDEAARRPLVYHYGPISSGC